MGNIQENFVYQYNNLTPKKTFIMFHNLLIIID